MNNRPEALALRLRAEGDAALAFFKQLTPEQWLCRIYPTPVAGAADEAAADAAADGWRVRDVLAHFIGAEQGFQQLIQNVAADGADVDDTLPPGVDFDIHAYNAHTVREMRQQDLEVLLGQFAMVRERTAALVQGLDPADLDHKGHHPTLGVAPLDDMIRAIYHHNNLHLRDARLALKQRGVGSSLQAGVLE